MNMRKHVTGAAVAALMMTGMAYEWTMSALGGTTAAVPKVTVVSAHAADGAVCLDTKFFLPMRADRPGVDVQQRHESLEALLTTYEER
ncbi:hypothetical protein [Parapedobacter soli]|uniref:hypothetical protein n=1 Tax=Parapedobacter soli TaxID=416955 RepID=UPI0021C99795|nr:hypothetical protein [Parapedobacter soli]